MLDKARYFQRNEGIIDAYQKQELVMRWALKYAKTMQHKGVDESEVGKIHTVSGKDIP